MAFFTLILDYESGTYVSQHTAETPSEAVEMWKAANADDHNFGMITGVMLAEDDYLVSMGGLSNVWCASGTNGERFGLLNVIRTVEAE